MTKKDIFAVIAILSFVSICYGGIAIGTLWFIPSEQEVSMSIHIANGFAVLAPLVGIVVNTFLSVGLWINPDHDAVLGRT